MTANGAIEYDDLLSAFEWVNASHLGDNSAFVCRETGAIHWGSNSADLEDELPDDIDDGRLYVAVPHGSELGLGKRMALAFTEEVLPHSTSEVAGFFRRPGAFPRFRELLGREQRVEEWREFERLATARAQAWLVRVSRLQGLQRLFGRHEFRFLAGGALSPPKHLPTNEALHAMPLSMLRTFERLDFI